MLWQRIITALILLPLVLFAIFFLSLESFSFIMALVILIGCWEWSGFIAKIPFLYRVIYVGVSAGLMALVYKGSLPLAYWNGWMMPEGITEWLQISDLAFLSLILSAIWWLFAFILILIFPGMSQSLVKNILLMALVGWLILIPTWVAFTGLRSIGMALDFHRGSNMLLFTLCLVWAADTGAFILILIFPGMSQSLVKNILLMALVGWLILIPTWVAFTGLRSIGMALDFHRGSNMLLFTLCLVWAADTGAFIAGKLFGKHKLAPHVSPKKTWEGVFGGVLFATLVVIAAVNILSIPEPQLPGLIFMTIIIVTFSIVGDLTESIFKRHAGVKDSGHILPGHGGILDRIDGLTAAMPLCLLGFAMLGIN